MARFGSYASSPVAAFAATATFILSRPGPALFSPFTSKETLMKTALFTVIAAIAAFPVLAETVSFDPATLPGQTVYDAATLTPLALSAGGSPAVVLLDVAAGQLVPPHATETGLRLLTVISGDMSWGDGDTVDPAAERIYPAGSFLLLPPGEMHWLAARGDAVRLQLVVLDDETPVPAIADLLK